MASSVSPKRILVVTPVTGGSRLVAQDMCDAFRDHGLDVTEFDAKTNLGTFSGPGPEMNDAIERLNQTLMSEAARIMPDLVLVLALAPVRRSTLFQIRGKGTKIALWWVEDFRLWNLWEGFVGAVDHFFVVQPGEFASLLEQLGSKCHYLPTGFNAQNEFDKDKGRDRDVVFVGSPYRNRMGVFEELTKRNVPISIWGGGWEKRDLSPALLSRVQAPKGWMSPDQFAGVFGTARIAVNLHSSPYREYGIHTDGDFLNRWVFSIPACGAMQLVDRRPLVSRFFKEGESVECYSTVDELEAKIRHYLDHPQEAERIARNGQEIATAHHSCFHRAQEILQVVAKG